MLKTLFRSSLVIALWLAWKHTAALPLCLTFWIIVLIWGVRPIASRCPSAVWVLVLIGVLSNAVVTLANSGVMPGSQIGEKNPITLIHSWNICTKGTCTPTPCRPRASQHSPGGACVSRLATRLSP